MDNYIDKLFITLGKQLMDIYKKGLCNSKSFTTNNKKVDDFLELALNLSKDGYAPNIIDSELSFNISKHILNKDIDEITLHSMEIIRKTVQAIISYSRYLCSSKTVRELQQILNDIITSLVF